MSLEALQARLDYLEKQMSALADRTEKAEVRRGKFADHLYTIDRKVITLQSDVETVKNQGHTMLELLQDQARHQRERQEARDNTDYEIDKRRHELQMAQQEATQANWRQFWKILAGVLSLGTMLAGGGYFSGRWSAQEQADQRVEAMQAEVEEAKAKIGNKPGASAPEALDNSQH